MMWCLQIFQRLQVQVPWRHQCHVEHHHPRRQELVLVLLWQPEHKRTKLMCLYINTYREHRFMFVVENDLPLQGLRLLLGHNQAGELHDLTQWSLLLQLESLSLLHGDNNSWPCQVFLMTLECWNYLFGKWKLTILSCKNTLDKNWHVGDCLEPLDILFL